MGGMDSHFAENNRGKTSIYNAMRWCLFGQVSERAKTVAGKRYDGGIISMVGDGEILMNSTAYEEDSTQEMSVMLLAEGSVERFRSQELLVRQPPSHAPMKRWK